MNYIGFIFSFFVCFMHAIKRMSSISATLEMLYEHDEFISSINTPIKSLNPIGSKDI